MDKDKTLGIWFFAIQIGLAILLYWMAARRTREKTIIAANAAKENAEPDFAGTWNYVGPPAGFQSTINVYADNPLAAGLAYQYMPIFGLVGFNTAGFPGA